MRWLAWKMLTGDSAKYLGIVFGVTFGTLLIAQQTSLFVGLMRRTSSQIMDVTDADFWVMDSRTNNVDDIRPLADSDLYRVRGVPGVQWAVRFYKGMARVRLADGNFRQGILIGIDDASLAGAPRKMVMGSLDDLRRPDSILVDEAGYQYLFPGAPLKVGRYVEMNDRRAIIVGICKVSQPFQTFPVLFTRYSQAIRYVPRERNVLSFVVGKVRPSEAVDRVCERISQQTGLKAMSGDRFFWFNIDYYLKSTGIPINFGITVALGFIVGTAIAGQTFYLFTLDNLKQFGSLKAMGVTNLRLVGMILQQSFTVGVIGFGLGMGLASLFFESMNRNTNAALWGMFIPWQIFLISGGAVTLICIFSSLLSIRKVLVLEPAVVFK